MLQNDQSEVIAFLADPASHGGLPVKHVETHGAHVFLAGDEALKLKRAVRYDYLDFSTAEKREAMLRRELALNRPAAPEIYRDVLPVTRESDGRLALDGTGAPVDWVLRMWRFPAEDELSAIAARGALDDSLAEALGRAVAAYHGRAEPRVDDGEELIAEILEELRDAFDGMADLLGADRTRAFATMAAAQLDALAPLMTARTRAGHVRRGHSDLHLGNLVLIDGRPVPFDALEFDERLGTCDVLYDLAFLLMDLCHRGLPRAANIVLAGYLFADGGAQDNGMAAMPLFMAVRAAIRSMVAVQTGRARGDPAAARS
ncbi:MAG: phosphotransferase, partial [Paracoccaceae bacterium]